MSSWLSTLNLPQNPNEFCGRMKLLLQKKQAGNTSNIVNEENVAVADKLLELKCISTQQHKITGNKCLN